MTMTMTMTMTMAGGHATLRGARTPMVLLHKHTLAAAGCSCADSEAFHLTARRRTWQWHRALKCVDRLSDLRMT
ncbi:MULTISPECIES: hypothetical protein [Xanthomonas]|nr:MULTISPECIES: hypothetical protein [Xanthomonas]AOY64237.1 hypothetical protein BHE84_20170 [Xanthomonas citri pv. glycines str. 8ra]ARV21903.1 hypothetical protein A9D66_04580 [Xanthomonas citri pv. glycines str. 12-2]KAB0541363.1 hypothetical protein F7R02_00355 [Xanthomonas cissicola]QDS06285.1 hypothetical protein FPL00_04850 [Xanthomonas citri pv. glycines]QDS19194.1 hypothetical protein FPL05_04990 [Xanthomonas citri pv. glycines]